MLKNQKCLFTFVFTLAIVLTLISIASIECLRIFIKSEALKHISSENQIIEIPSSLISTLIGIVLGLIFFDMQKLSLRKEKNITFLVNYSLINKRSLFLFIKMWFIYFRPYLYMSLVGLAYFVTINAREYSFWRYSFIPNPFAALIPNILIYPECKNIHLRIEQKLRIKDDKGVNLS